jgi:hypothetical protein
MKNKTITTPLPGETASARQRKTADPRVISKPAEFVGEPWLARSVPKSGVAGRMISWQDGGVHLQNLP